MHRGGFDVFRYWLIVLTGLGLGSIPSATAADWKADPPAKASDWKPHDAPIALDGSRCQITFAEHFGPFAVVNDSKARPTRIVFDLRTGRESARFPATDIALINMPDLLSPDGAYGVRLTQVTSKTLEVTTLADGNVRNITLPAFAANYAWLDSDRLVAFLWGAKSEFVIVEAATGNVGKPVAIPGKAFVGLGPINRLFSVSPGGQFVAVPTDEGIALFDTAAGTCELTVREPLKAGKTATGLPLPPALAFSADGSQLALLTSIDADNGTLKIWTAGEASPKTVAAVRAKHAAYSTTRSLRPIRSGGWFLDEETLMNAEGQVVRTIPTLLPSAARLALDPDTVIAARAVQIGKSSELAVVRESGPKTRPVIAADFRNARKLPVNTEPFLGSFASAPALVPMKPFQIESTDFRSVVALHVARNGRWAVVERDSSSSADTVQKRAVSVWTESSSGPAIELPPERWVFGEFADDSGFLTVDSTSPPSPTLAFHDAAGEMLCRWQPSPTRAGGVLFAAVIDKQRVVTLDRGGLLVGWRMPRCEPEWTVELPGAGSATLSPEGDQILIAAPTGLHIFSAQFGTGFGTIAANLGKNLSTAAIRVRGDGQQIVASIFVGQTFRYFVWNLFAHRTKKDFAAPFGAGPIQTHLGGELVFDGFKVVDVVAERDVWDVIAIGGKPAVSAPADGRLWYFLRAKGGSFPTLAQAVPFPRRGVEAVLAAETNATERYLRPGSQIRLQLDWSAAPLRFRAEALAKVTEHLKAGGVTITDDAPLTLSLTATATPTGDTLNLTWYDIKKLGQQETVKPYNVRCKSELKLNGRILKSSDSGEYKMDLGRSNLTVTITDDSTTAREFFDRQVWKQAAFWVGSYLAVPGPLAFTSTGDPIELPGRSQLKPGELETVWPNGIPIPQEPNSIPIQDGQPVNLDPEHATPVANPGPKWIWIAGCGGAAVLLIGITGVGLLVGLTRKKKTEPVVIRKRPPVVRAKKLRDADDD